MMGSRGTCKHWRLGEATGGAAGTTSGDCERIYKPGMASLRPISFSLAVAPSASIRPQLVTLRDFGCTQWERS